MSSRRKRWKAALPSRISSRCRCASRSDVLNIRRQKTWRKSIRAVLDELAKEVADAAGKGHSKCRKNIEPYRRLQVLDAGAGRGKCYL